MVMFASAQHCTSRASKVTTRQARTPKQGHLLAVAVPTVRTTRPANKENTMSLGTILIIFLILMLIGVFPTWPHSRNWGYAPSGGVGLLVIILIILLLTGRL